MQDRLAPSWIGRINERTSTPIVGLTFTMIACAALLISNQMSLALNIAVFALVLLYFLHSLAFLLLPYWNRQLWREVTVRIPVWLQRAATVLSLIAMGSLIVVQVVQDSQILRTQTLHERIVNQSLTGLELAIVWSLIGVALYAYARPMRNRSR